MSLRALPLHPPHGPIGRWIPPEKMPLREAGFTVELLGAGNGTL
ncbi:hypothetical protein [Deinococcus hopiensis]|uniref:Uncharacterized protein n=1 Tax=Deinococcus hopiensis KR-140 TaxID=695939 RepID=A0A1W1UJJ6_9DEIO|nr:hypothetical protein [Deinococcus hopiensis]SMB81247.1 hypothetical protein SAMN00790413_04510 [Deinococcus hopiensis KR-140]